MDQSTQSGHVKCSQFTYPQFYWAGFPAHIDFNKCRETIASALNDYCTRWCKREHVESNALNNWKLKIFKIIDERVLFYSNNLDLLLLSLYYLFDI